jgi:Fur family ferric uptake transcriptional regulator
VIREREASATEDMDTPASTAATVADAIAAVRSNGLRVSTSRRMVLEALFAAGEPVCADRIAKGLDGRLPPLDVASVYRNLETLEGLGVVTHFHAGHGPGLWTLAGPEVREYLVCESCGTVRAVDPRALDNVRARLREDVGWSARFTHFAIPGTCPACSDAH